METKKILLILGLIGGTFVLLYAGYFATSRPEQTFFEQLATLNEKDHAKWSTQKKNILIEYSDFQCPACSSYYAMLKTFEGDPENKSLVDQVTFVYRHFPLDQIHPHAREAAYAAEAAALQNQFFAYHDVLFEKQGEWSETGDPYPLFEQYATDLKLDTEQFKTDYSSDSVKEKVQADYLSGIDVDVEGTPTFYLNGMKMQNPQSADQLKQILLDLVEQNQQ